MVKENLTYTVSLIAILLLWLLKKVVKETKDETESIVSFYGR